MPVTFESDFLFPRIFFCKTIQQPLIHFQVPFQHLYPLLFFNIIHRDYFCISIKMNKTKSIQSLLLSINQTISQMKKKRTKGTRFSRIERV